MKPVWVQPHRRRLSDGSEVVIMGHWRGDPLVGVPVAEKAAEVQPTPKNIWERLLEDEPE